MNFQIWRMESLKAQNNNVKIPASKYFELSLENGFPSTLICVSLFTTVALIFFQFKALL